MNKVLAVIAADGRSGQAFIGEALKAGYVVRAGYRSNDPFTPRANLSTFACDATNENDVRKLLSGSTVVVSLIGHVKGSPARVQTDAMKTIVKIMNELQITRIISLTGTGVRMPGDTASALDRLMNFSIKHIDPERIQDGVEHAQLLRSTNLEWTILRVLKLSNARSDTQKVKLSLSGPAALMTSRQEVAKAILSVIETDEYNLKAPILQ